MYVGFEYVIKNYRIGHYNAMSSFCSLLFILHPVHTVLYILFCCSTVKDLKFSNLTDYTGTFLVGAYRFGVPFPKLQMFSRIFWVLPIEYCLYERTAVGMFVYLFISKVTGTKVNFSF